MHTWMRGIHRNREENLTAEHGPSVGPIEFVPWAAVTDPSAIQCAYSDYGFDPLELGKDPASLSR